MLSFYQGRFVAGSWFGQPVRSAQSVSTLAGYYKFSFVVDPFDHLVREICELISWERGKKCNAAVREGKVSAELRGLFERAVTQRSTAC